MATVELSHARYRLLAQQCLDMLSTTSDATMRLSLLELAHTWVRLAQEHEATTSNTASERQPVTQQQQQTQPSRRRTTTSAVR
jgi:hypothetical protein